MTMLSDILSSRVRAEIFRLLFGTDRKELHLREIERCSGLNVATVRQDLTKLAKLGLVESRRDGNRLCYRANCNHPLYQDIHSLALKTAGLAEVLRKAMEHKAIQIAFIFGSIAAGTANADSDVDLMVIGNLGLRELARHLSGVSHHLGREINPHVLTEKEFLKRRGTKDDFVNRVMSSAKIFVVGNEDDLAAMG